MNLHEYASPGKYYGSPCEFGHILRYESNRTCVECKKIKGAKAFKDKYVPVPEEKRTRRARNSVSLRNELGHKFCPRLKHWKAESNFNKSKANPDGLSQYCRECSKWDRLARTYGVDEQMFSDMLASQNGTCATCPATVKLVIDHNHGCCPGQKTCGKCVRSILCHSCNTVVGYSQEDSNRLRRIADYVERHRQ